MFQFVRSTLVARSPTSNVYIRPSATDSRSPCPALNVLANHGYIARSGNNIAFLDLCLAVQNVYNLSFLLALFLTLVGFLTCGKLSWRPLRRMQDESGATSIMRSLFPTCTINLTSLSKRGSTKIAHDSSFVHPDGRPSTSPDPTLLEDLLRFASHAHNTPGLTLHDLGRLHAKREASSGRPLNSLHAQVAQGECGLTWLVMREHGTASHQEGAPEIESIIPLSRLEQWFGEERLPDNWWECVRPVDQVGLLETRKRANYVAHVA